MGYTIKFQVNSCKSSVIHWDGKLLTLLSYTNLVDQLSVIISSKNDKQLLGRQI